MNIVTDSEVQYEIKLLRDDGTRLKTLDSVEKFEYTNVVNGLGDWSLTLDYGFDKTLIDFYRRIEFWRRPPGGMLSLDFMGLLLDIEQWQDDNGNERLRIGGESFNHILSGRQIAYYAGHAQADQTDQADDLMYNIVSYNLGSNATTANGRKLAGNLSSTYFSVEGNNGLGPSISKAFSYRSVFEVLVEIASAARTAGTEVYFMVERYDDNKVVFRTKIDQPGNVRTSDLANGLTFGTTFGTLKNPRLLRSVRSQINVGYGLGQNEGAAREVQTSEDTTRSGASLWSKREGKIWATLDASAASVLDAADQLITENRIGQRFTGDLVNRAGALYGKDWGFGDRITISEFGYQFEALIRAATVSVAGDKKEKITSHIEAYL